MTAFVRLLKPKPIPLFVTQLEAMRPALERAYLDACQAQSESCGLTDHLMRAAVSPDEQLDDSVRVRAYAEEVRANLQATVVLLSVDDALQRLGKAILGKPLGISRGFGAVCNGVALTRVLRATTNCVRHVSEWDDDQELVFPYASPADESDPRLRRSVENIAILQQAFGIGKHERIWSAPAFALLSVIDGSFGTEDPDYQRVESKIIGAAREITVAAANPSLLAEFDRAWR